MWGILRGRRRVSVSAGHHDERLHTLWVFFDGTYRGGTIRIQAGERNGAAWFPDPPGRLQRCAGFRAAEW